MLRSRCLLSAAGAAMLLLAACAAHKPRPGRQHAQHGVTTPKTATAKPDKPRGSDALAPGEVSYYLDVLQGRLQQSVDPGVIVSRTGSGIALDFSRRVGFAAAGAHPDDADRALLAPLSKVLAEYRMTRVWVRVSADGDASAASALAQQRASAIARVLEESGIAAARIRASAAAVMARDGDAHVEVELEPIVRAE